MATPLFRPAIGRSLSRRNGKLRWSLILTILPAFVLAASEVRNSTDLVDARTVLKEISQAAPSSAPHASEAATLVSDIRKFRAVEGGPSPHQAALAWFRLLDRASSIGSHAESSQGDSYDVDVRRPVGVPSVISALPAPDAWKELRSEAKKRSPQSPNDYHALGLQLLPEVLLGDRAATNSTLKAIEAAIATLPPDQRVVPRSNVIRVRRALTALYGTPSEVAEGFRADVAEAANDPLGMSRYSSDVEVPDLVTLVGEPEATKILTEVIRQPIAFRVESGDATRALAQRIALDNVETLKVPQWSLVDSVDAAPLYEALVRRFAANPTKQAADAGSSFGDFARENADTYHLLFLIINGRVSEAEVALNSMAGGRLLTIPKPAIHALQKAHQNQALYAFLGGVLSRNPEVPAWDVYIQQAAYTGHSREALATLDAALKRPTLPPYLSADLQRRRADALFALDDTDHGLNAIETLLRQPPAGTDPYFAERVNASLRLAGLGRVLGRPDLANKGLQFTQTSLALPAQGKARVFDRLTVLRSFFAEARKQNKQTDAQRVAIAELTRRDPNTDSGADQMEMVGMPALRPLHRAALIELVSLYAVANRPEDARILLDEAEGWGARDIRELLGEKDSQGVPFAVSAAKVLAATNDAPAAIRLLTATIAQFPGHDAAYELESTIDPQALAVFETQSRTDQFEERPLIWKAVLLERSTQYAAAEQTVRAAIAIDPSDGDEGVNDRMRAYSVLADILDARGDAKGAAEFREIVTAIRLSERTDELYALGLYQRAFAGYRAALEHFSDAYCIQSRLAVQLSKQGKHDEAAEHYRRAYELMPSSFGRVESHCFGCESVFDGIQQQGIAEQVFRTLVKKDPTNAQVHYLQGYLFEEEGRYTDALPAFRTAVQIDGNYLNAWRQLNKLSTHIYVDAVDRDVVTTKLLELDPEQRHVTYDLGSIGDFVSLWNTVAQVARERGSPPYKGPLYSLKQSARFYDEKQAALPAQLRSQMQQFQALYAEAQLGHGVPSPPLALGKHRLLARIGSLIGSDDAPSFPDYPESE